jgi:hypothetical protein
MEKEITMPSLYKRKSQAGTTWNLQLNELPNRPRVGFGRCTKSTAEGFRVGVVALLGARETGGTLDGRTAMWLQALPDETRQKLYKAGLLGDFEKVPTVGELCDRHLRDHAAHLKPGTKDGYDEAAAMLKRGLGKDKRLDRISAQDARQFHRWLYRRDGDAPWAEATTRGVLRYCKAILQSAVDAKFIAWNPLKDKNIPTSALAADKPFVSAADVLKVMDALPDFRWRLLLGLCRYAGLRCPSETHVLTWADVAWDAKRLSVYSSKTDSRRMVPITSDLMPLLEQAFDAATVGQARVLDLSANNLSRTVRAAIKRAGLTPWSHLFHSLRASRETDWSRHHPQHAVSSWLGHSMAVSQKHYLQTTDDMFDAASNHPGLCVQIRERSSADGGGQGRSGPQNAQARPRTQNVRFFPIKTPYPAMGAAGFEPAT